MLTEIHIYDNISDHTNVHVWVDRRNALKKAKKYTQQKQINALCIIITIITRQTKLQTTQISSSGMTGGLDQRLEPVIQLMGTPLPYLYLMDLTR